MANADLLPAANDVLADKYRIEHVLGQGGMGVVVAAMHIHLEERVAIKFLLPELSHEPALVARFLREGRAAIKIRSEHVVRVLDVGTLPGGTPYMVMEYLEGTNFEDLLEQQGRSPHRASPSTTCSRRARPSPKRTRSGSSIATSSPPTSFSCTGPTAARASRCSTSGSRR